jgi:hypothetical protein
MESTEITESISVIDLGKYVVRKICGEEIIASGIETAIIQKINRDSDLSM